MNLSPSIVKNKTFWTPVSHVKVEFSLLLERILVSKKKMKVSSIFYLV